MLVRSIPFYLEQQYMIKKIGKKFWVLGTDIYDLGCSTGTTLINLCREIDGSACFIRYDNSIPMLDQAKRKSKEHELENRIEFRHYDLNKNLTKLSLKNASIVTMCWSLQFVRPLRRDGLILQ
jgi:tRNA (cmo5U34)-methyltransferase